MIDSFHRYLGSSNPVNWLDKNIWSLTHNNFSWNVVFAESSSTISFFFFFYNFSQIQWKIQPSFLGHFHHFWSFAERKFFPKICVSEKINKPITRKLPHRRKNRSRTEGWKDRWNRKTQIHRTFPATAWVQKIADASFKLSGKTDLLDPKKEDFSSIRGKC